MATSDQEQKGINVPQHKRLAMGEKLTGASQQATGQAKSAPKQSGLSHVKSKK